MLEGIVIVLIMYSNKLDGFRCVWVLEYVVLGVRELNGFCLSRYIWYLKLYFLLFLSIIRLFKVFNFLDVSLNIYGVFFIY